MKATSKSTLVVLLYLSLLIAVAILPVSCEKAFQFKEPETKPVAVFNDLWTALARNYSLFSVKSINWDSVKKATAPLVTNNLSDDELFTILSNTLNLLKDGHISLQTPQRIYTYENFYKAYPGNFNFKNIEITYLKNMYQKKGPIIYKIADSIGYLHYSDFREPITNADLDKIFDTLQSTKGLILDIRNNSGGNLSAAELLFSKFINTRVLVRYELKKNGPEYSNFKPKQPYYVTPATLFYNKPIVVLTNRKCFSAGNDFAMYMSYLNNVILIGDQTGGGGSVPNNYVLSNGWKLQYSATLTLSPDELPIENGILPDISINITPIQETQGIDPILERAYQILR